ncbi:MAG: hypothetical protein ACRCTZ_13905 [Sarcina sp.]
MMQENQIPSTMKVNIGGKDYTYELKEELETVCPFKVGDIIVYRSRVDDDDYAICLFEGASPEVYRTYYMWSTSSSLSKTDRDGSHFSLYKHATLSQARFFKQKCLEKGIWFDKINEKWIDLKKGHIYNVDGCVEIFEDFTLRNLSFNSKYTLKGDGKLFDLGYVTPYTNIENISEATEDAKQLLYSKLREVNKQYNEETRCVEPLSWKPEIGEIYWCITDGFKVAKEKCHEGEFCKRRLGAGNCFKTEEECDAAANHLKKHLIDYKKSKLVAE